MEQLLGTSLTPVIFIRGCVSSVLCRPLQVWYVEILMSVLVLSVDPVRYMCSSYMCIETNTMWRDGTGDCLPSIYIVQKISMIEEGLCHVRAGTLIIVKIFLISESFSVDMNNYKDKDSQKI